MPILNWALGHRLAGAWNEAKLSLRSHWCLYLTQTGIGQIYLVPRSIPRYVGSEAVSVLQWMVPDGSVYYNVQASLAPPEVAVVEPLRLD